MQYEDILQRLKTLYNPMAIEGMARFGVNPDNTYGISIPNLRKMARDIGKDHALAQQLWETGIHEAKILASMIDDSKLVTAAQMESWVVGFDSWDVCDQCCMNLFDKTAVAYQQAEEWCGREGEFVKRAGFALIAALAVHDKKASDDKLIRFLSLIKRESNDNRNFVRKAVNWALRQIGKRNLNLNKLAVETATEIQHMDSKSARWIAVDAIRELTSDAVKERLLK